MRTIPVALVALCVGSVCGFAQDIHVKPKVAVCAAPLMLTEKAAKDIASRMAGVTYTVFDAEDGAALLKAINEEEPKSDYKGDTLVILQSEKVVVVMISDHGCIDHKHDIAVKTAAFNELVEKTFGLRM